ncbi:MAG: hypothetical protein QM811_13405 [Pirellulales bacterium]
MIKAWVTGRMHAEVETRERAEAKIAKWRAVLANIVDGSAAYGSRTPIANVPSWATLEVVTGGFATGRLLAGGDLLPYENALGERLGIRIVDGNRSALNIHYLSEAGLAELRNMRTSGCYDVQVPEEGALLVVDWLLAEEKYESASALLDVISPLFSDLRFYPLPTERPSQERTRIDLQNVGQTIADLERMNPNAKILAQREATEVWAPYLDRLISLFWETVVEDWPCRRYPDGWAHCAEGLLAEYVDIRKHHMLCGEPDRVRGHFAQLRAFMAICAERPNSLTGRQVGRIRLILDRYFAKRGLPDSAQCRACALVSVTPSLTPYMPICEGSSSHD